MAKRVFLVVLDSFGVGEEPDAASFGDYGVNTLRSIAQSSSFNCPNLRALGLFNLDGIDFLPSFPKPLGAFGRLRERSMGKDTTIGHWSLRDWKAHLLSLLTLTDSHRRSSKI